MNSVMADRRHFGPAWPDQAADGPADADVRAWARGTFLVRLWGRLPAGWLRALALGLARDRMGIVRGFARPMGFGRWVAELQILPSPDADALTAERCMALARSEPRDGHAAAPVLDSYYVDRSPEAGGALLLEVRAADGPELLGSLLDPLAALSLHPEETVIETHGGLFQGCFALRGAGGRLPSDEAQRALVALLESLMLQHRRGPVPA